MKTLTHCERCGKATKSFQMSFFNKDECCKDCLTEEAQHPDYQKAKEIELEHVKNGDYNFEGIGLPKNLAQKYGR